MSMTALKKNHPGRAREISVIQLASYHGGEKKLGDKRTGVRMILISTISSLVDFQSCIHTILSKYFLKAKILINVFKQ